MRILFKFQMRGESEREIGRERERESGNKGEENKMWGWVGPFWNLNSTLILDGIAYTND